MADILGVVDLASLGTLFATLGIFMIIGAIAVYAYAAYALMTIANKTKTKNSWLAWIPIANVWLIVKIAEQPDWQVLALLLYFVPVVGSIAFLAVTAFWFWKISENVDKPGWLGILMILPVINLIVMGILAWAD